MAYEVLKRDQNHVTVLAGITDDSNEYITMLRVDPTTKRLKISGTISSGSGTVTSVSVVSANGFAGTVATATTTPAITLSTTVTGILSGNGTAISAATTTGSGSVVLATSPTLVTPVLGVASATSINKVTITAPATSSTLTIADGKTLTASNTLTFTGTDSSSVNFGAGGTVLYTTSIVPLTVGTTTIASGTTTRVLYNNGGVLGEYTISGSGNIAMTTSPVFTTPALGVASATSINKVAITAPATSATLTIVDGKTLTVNNSVTLAGTDSTTMTFPTTSATIARTDAGQTFTGTQTLAENASIALDPAGSADGKYTGITIAGTAGAALAFGDLVYLAAADSRWELADADAASTSGDVQLGMCVLAAAADGDPTVLLLYGNIRADAAFPALTIGAPAYVSTTAGDIQVAQPSGTDDVIRRVGFALTADELLFNPSNDYVTHV